MFENSRQVTTNHHVLACTEVRGPVPILKMAEVIVSSPI
jgi:hypothetical protein